MVDIKKKHDYCQINSESNKIFSRFYVLIDDLVIDFLLYLTVFNNSMIQAHNWSIFVSLSLSSF